jgi:2-oxoglutarate dehydrogenase E2 component (dihydrolipoamide succinyltransferase)
MGDSITEGTIKSWEKKVGDAVAVDEVVVVIETDKVSVDIRAKDAGVLVEQFAAVDDNVEVGAKLLKIDTAASASASASSPSPAKTAPPPPPPPPPPSAAATAAPPPPTPAAPPAPTTASEPHRKPLIKFLGKRSLIGKGGSPAAAPPSKATGPAPVRYEDLKSTPGAKTFGEMPAMFGRPALSQKEIDAIESGGATL